MEPTIHPLEASGNETLSTETIPSLEVPVNSSVEDEMSTTQLQLSITLERLRLESSETERLLELVRLEQLRVADAAEERKFRADQAERDREVELVRLEQLRVADAAEERKFRADQAEKDRELELVRLEQLRVSEQVAAEQSAEERKFRAEQAERDRELEKIQIESQSDRHGSESWREKLENFAGSTTMHGAPKIILQKSLIRRLIWLLCFIGSWTMFFVQIQLVFRNYFTYPKNTQVEIVSNHREFPDLTFCFRRGVSFYDAHEWLMRKQERLMENKTLKSTMADMKIVNTFVIDASYIDPIFHSVEFQAFINRSAITKKEAFIIFRWVSNKIITNVKYKNIDLEMVKEIPGRQFLKCFTVPVEQSCISGVDTIEGYLLTGSGMIEDMSEERGYPWKGLLSEEGAIVYIHQPGVEVNPIYDKQFFNLQPNHAYNFLVNVKQHIRLDHPHGQCSSRDPYVQGGQKRPDVPYRQQACELACMSKQILDRHGTVSMLFPPLDGMRCWLDKNEDDDDYIKRWCNYTETDSGHPGKMIASLWSPGVNSTDCPCYPPCSETDYDVSVTSRLNPFKSDRDDDQLYHSFEKFLQDNDEDEKFRFLAEYLFRNRTRALEDVTRFTIQIGKTIHKTIESPLISPTQLISEIGGQLGVWIGISVITLVEVIELLVDLCVGCFRRGRKKELETSGGTTRKDGDIV